MDAHTQDELAGGAREQSAPIEPARCSEDATSSAPLSGATALFTLAALLVLAPFWAPLLLAAWLAIVASPLCGRIARRFHARSGAPALLTVILVLIVLLPLVVVVLSLTVSAVDLVRNLQHSESSRDALQRLSSSNVSLPLHAPSLEKTLDFARSHASGALNALRVAFGAVTQAVVGLVVFVAAFYMFLLKGADVYAWLVEHAPLRPAHSRRLGAAFVETGRGLLIGIGLTALLQGAFATVGYVVTAVPQAFVLGMLTVIAAMIPSIGSALVWVPVAAGLFIAGRTGAGIVMLIFGACTSTVDNVARPLLSRFGKLNLNGLLLFIAMLGGITIFGTWGILLGPLCVRLATESLEIFRESRE